MGQVYVLFSRVTDPRHLEPLGHRVDIESISFCTHVIYQAYLQLTSLKMLFERGKLLDLTSRNACSERQL